MQTFQALRRTRRIKQSLMSALFIAVLAFAWKFPLLGYSILLCMLLGIAIGITQGRRWCDWYCPRGSFYDAYAGMLSPHRRIPDLLRGYPVRLGVLGLLMAVVAYSFLRYWPDFTRIGLALVIMVSSTTIAGLFLAFFLHERAWCTVCPVGTMIKLVSRRKEGLFIRSNACVECKMCAKVCPLQIKAYAFKKEGDLPVTDKDCLGCGLCVSACPAKALYFAGRRKHEA
ncbi:MAG: 4Fe-4S binding protein [Candidatus Omnitrophica bacterium]|nr:4Fe-4S binding protein [Candidatus Omnitrophota bacterium]